MRFVKFTINGIARMINLYQVSDIQYVSGTSIVLIFYNTFDYSEVVTIESASDDEARLLFEKLEKACRPIDFDELDITEIRD
jgi:hypothetical protein